MQEINMLNQSFIILGTIIYLLGGTSYLIDTIRGKVKPNRVSWFIWSLAPVIAFFAEFSSGVGVSAIPVLTVGLIPFCIFIASVIRGKSGWKITRFDVSCGALSLAGLIIWLVTQTGTYAILFSLVSDLLASLPTVVKAYKSPKSENIFEYLGAMINIGISLFTVGKWSFAACAFPLYLIFIDTLIFGLIIRKPVRNFIRKVFVKRSESEDIDKKL
jgi:hypothetical protein